MGLSLPEQSEALDGCKPRDGDGGGEEMNRTDYAEQRRDPRWQKKRLQIMERDGFKCISCDASDKTLHIHHAYYVKGRMPWEYPNFSLSTMCWECHEIAHDRDFNEAAWGADTPYDPIAEWEHEVDWMFAGDAIESGRMWDLSALMAQASEVAGRDATIGAVTACLRKIVDERSEL